MSATDLGNAAVIQHSIIGASSMYRWSACPGSVRLCKDAPEVKSEYAAEGTYAHEMAAQFLMGDLPAEQFHKLPEEMKESLLVYSETVGEYLNPGWPKSRETSNQLFVEQKFDMSQVVYPGLFGTSDAVVWQPEKRHLVSIDFKYGKGVLVEVERNQQLMYYMLGALTTLKLPAKTCEAVVVQPRAKHKKGGVRRWVHPVTEYLDFEAELIEAAKRTEDPNAPLNPGRHCYFCPVKNTCPARHAQRLEDAQSEFSVVIDDDIFS